MHDAGAEQATDARGLLPIAVRTLRAAQDYNFDLYLPPVPGSPPRLYREKHFPLEAQDIARLLARGITTLFVAVDDAAQYGDFVRQRVLSDESLAPGERFGLLKDASRTVFVDSFRNGDVAGQLQVCAELGRDIVHLIWERETNLGDLVAVLAHDYSTFTHVTNVCTYCLFLAKAAGIRDRETLLQISQGALLHDLGKCFIPRQVLNKREALTDRERELISQHPMRGFKELCRRPDLSWGQLMMCYQHHERCDGRGYPVGLVGPEIHEWGRICAIADVFDALTRDRPYRKGADTSEVLEYLDRQAGRGFDEDLTQCWIATFRQCLNQNSSATCPAP